MTKGMSKNIDAPFNRLTDKEIDETPSILFGLGGPQKPLIREYAPLACLVWYLFLEYIDQHDRVKQTNALFSYALQEDIVKQVFEKIENNETAHACYQAAQKALETGEIERYQSSSLWFPWTKKNIYAEAYTISFLIWADRSGYRIPYYAVPDTEGYHELFAIGEIARKRETEYFPLLQREELEYLRKEPLWTFPKAVLYLIGRNSARDQNALIKYIESHGAAKKIVEYARDAAKTFELRLIDYSPMNFNFDQKPQSQIDEKIYDAKVKPDEILKWADTLPLNLQIPNMNTEPLYIPESVPAEKPLTEKTKKAIAQRKVKENVQQDTILKLEFSDLSGEVVLNNILTLACPTPNGQNYKIIRYLIQNPNRFVSKDELEKRALNGKALDKRLTDFAAQINMGKDIGKVFFDTSKDSIRLHNPVSPERMAELNVKRIRIKPA